MSVLISNQKSPIVKPTFSFSYFCLVAAVLDYLCFNSFPISEPFSGRFKRKTSLINTGYNKEYFPLFPEFRGFAFC